MHWRWGLQHAGLGAALGGAPGRPPDPAPAPVHHCQGMPAAQARPSPQPAPAIIASSLPTWKTTSVQVHCLATAPFGPPGRGKPTSAGPEQWPWEHSLRAGRVGAHQGVCEAAEGAVLDELCVNATLPGVLDLRQATERESGRCEIIKRQS